MKRTLSIYITLKLILVSHFAFCQYTIVWEKTFGGTQQDSGHKVQKTQDGGFIVSGFTNSNDLDVAEHYGNGDYWVVKLDSMGNAKWERNYGGTDAETGCDIIEITGGYLIAGNSRSTDNDVSENNGRSDIWIAKINQNGDLEWEENYGGSEQDIFQSIIQTNDNGFLLTAYTRSIDGDLNSSVQGNDYWVLKLNELGEIEWQHNYGGSQSDFASKGIETIDNNFVIVGWSSSNDGDVPGNRGQSDIWMIKLNRDGSIIWSKVFGEEQSEVATSIKELDDGSMIVVGWIRNWEPNPETDTNDFLVLRVNSNGNLIWSKTYGGSGKDLAFDIEKTEKELFVIGRSNSEDLGQSYGSDDFLLFTTDLNGIVIDTLSFGGSDLDRPLSIKCVSDTSLVVTGLTYSSDIDISQNNGNSDLWIFKLSKESNIENDNMGESGNNNNNRPCEITIYPNPTFETINFIEKDLVEGKQLNIFDTTGKLVLEKSIVENSIDISSLISGHYLLEINNTVCKYQKQIIVAKD